MRMNYQVEEVVRKRYSVRTYEERELETALIEEVKEYIKGRSNPFGGNVRFFSFEMESVEQGEKIGTYGVLKGIQYFFGTAIKKEKKVEDLLALGYEFEDVVLYLESRGLGTCWLGGTFERKKVITQMELADNEIMPAISPYGYAKDQKRITEVAMRKSIKADKRVNAEDIFFETVFGKPLDVKNDRCSLPLEMVRLAPSASNKQPWRVIKKGSEYHFYEAKEEGYSEERLGFDI